MTQPQTNPPAQRSAASINAYATQKTVANGLFDIALLTANAAQLKLVLQGGDSNPYYHALVTLISISIVLQVITGVFLLILSQERLDTLFEDTDEMRKKRRIMWRLNVASTALIFFIAVINIFISAFGLAKP